MQKDDVSFFGFQESKLKAVSKNKLRSSSLYNTLERLIAIQSKDLAKLDIQHVNNDSQQVYYIKLAKPAHQLIKDYKFQENHLTIHKYYKDKHLNSKNGLSMAHYTETYINSDQEEIVIHVYFNRYGVYHYTQIKQYKGRRDVVDYTELPVNSNLEELLKININQAQSILTILLKENEKLRQSYFVEANNQEQELQQISQKLEKDSVNAYIKVGTKFINTIEMLNQYLDDGYDARGEVMAKQVEYLKNHALKQRNDTRTASHENKELISIPTQATDDNKATNEAITQTYQELLNYEKQLQKLNKQLEHLKLDIKLLTEKHELVNTIRIKLLLASSILPRTPIYQKQLTTLQNIIDNDKNIYAIFKNEFWEGNLETVKQIYPLIQDQIICFVNAELFIKLITHKPTNEKEESRIRSVFNFLHEVSPSFQLLISSDNTFFFPDSKKKQFYFSILELACRHDNLFAFKLLLEHGVDPNSCGALFETTQVPLLFQLILHSHNDSAKLVFIEEWLKFGGQYECKCKQLAIDERRTKKLNPSNIFAKLCKTSTKQISEETHAYQWVATCNNALELCFKTKNINAIHLLLPQLKLEDVLYCFANLTIRINFSSQYIIPSTQFGLFVTETQDTADLLCDALINDPSNQELLALVIFARDESMPIDLAIKLCNFLTEKIRYNFANAPFTLTKLCADLFNEAKNLSAIPKVPIDQVWRYQACICLLLLMPNPNVSRIQTIIKLYCYQADSLNKNGRAKEKVVSTLYLAALIVYQTKYKEELKASPILTLIKEKLQKEGYSLIELANDEISLTPLSNANSNEDRSVSKPSMP